MHWEQREVLETAGRRIEQLVYLLVRDGLEEDDALAVVRGTPDIEYLASTQPAGELFGQLFEAKRAKRPQTLVFDKEDPQFQKPPEHKDFMPNVTTPAVFNAQMAQASTPYVLAIANRIAEERGLEKPDDRIIKRVMKKIDWTKAAYEMKGMEPRPPKGKVIRFLDKIIFDPVDRAINELGIKRVWPLATGAMTPVLLYLALAAHIQRLEVPAKILAQRSADRLGRRGFSDFLRAMKSPQAKSIFRRGIRRAARWV